MHVKRDRGLRAALAAALAAGAIGAVASAPASAFTIEPPGTAFTGSGTEPAVFMTNNGNGPTVTCTTTSFTGRTSSPATDAVDVTPSYTGCTSNIGGGVRNATVTTPGTWTLRVTGGALPAYSGTVRINSGVTITIAGLSCVIDIAPGTTVAGAGVNDAGSPPAGTFINPRGSTISVPFSTSGVCLGVDRTQPAVYDGEVYARGVYVAP